MAKELIIAIEIADAPLAKSIEEQLRKLPDVQAIHLSWPTETRTTPDIIIIGDNPDTGEIFKRLPRFRQDFPQAATFVVSTDQRPEHIVEVMKAGVSEYLIAPVNPDTLQNAIDEVRCKLSNAGKVAKGSIYSFISAKGGLGSTVIAVNTATALSMGREKSVSFCDMSIQSGDASVLLDIVPQTTIIDICLNFHRLDVAFLRGAMIKNPTGLDFLAAPMNPEERESISPEHVSRIMELAKKLYDFTIVDCTSMFIDDCTIEALRQSDRVFLITDLSVTAVRNTVRLIHLLQKVGIDPQKIEVTVNRYIRGGTLSLDEVENTLDRRIFWLFPNDFDDVISSINRGIPLVKYHPNSSLARNVQDFVEKLIDPGISQDFRGIRGAFGRAI